MIIWFICTIGISVISSSHWKNYMYEDKELFNILKSKTQAFNYNEGAEQNGPFQLSNWISSFIEQCVRKCFLCFSLN